MIKKQYVGIFGILFSLIAPYFILKSVDYNIAVFNVHTYIWLCLFFLFISLHFFIKPKAIWNFIFSYRWLICAFLIITSIALKYNTSSIGVYDGYVQPNNAKSNIVLGTSRDIRSDEWASSTPLKLSQSQLKNPYSINSNLIMGKNTDVNLFPLLPNKSFSMLLHPELFGYILFGNTGGLSFDNMGQWIVFIFLSFEFVLVLTNKNKIVSLFGALIIGFAPAILWWNAFYSVIFGEAMVVLVYYFTQQKRMTFKIIFAVLIGWAIACDVATLYPAWLIPYSYVFFVMIMYILFTNLKKKDILSTVLCIILAFTVAICLFLPSYFSSREVIDLMNNTVYPGKRFAVGGIDKETMFNYIGSLFFFIKDSYNNSELSSYIGLFPATMVVGIWYIFKSLYLKFIKKCSRIKPDVLMILFVTILLLFVVNSVFTIPWLSRITLLYYSPIKRLAVVINYISLLILLRYIAINSEDKIKAIRILASCVLGVVICYFAMIIFNSYAQNYFLRYQFIIAFAMLVPLFILSLLNYKKTNYILLLLLSVYSVVSGILTLPINCGTSVLYDKPVSKEVRNIVLSSDKKWIAAFTGYPVANYLVANGASVINSTNYYANYEVWNKLDGFDKYSDVYNRYAYVQTVLTSDESKMELNQSDLFTVYFNPDDLSKLDIGYIYSSVDISSFNTKKTEFKELYFEDGSYIYEVISK